MIAIMKIINLLLIVTLSQAIDTRALKNKTSKMSEVPKTVKVITTKAPGNEKGMKGTHGSKEVKAMPTKLPLTKSTPGQKGKTSATPKIKLKVNKFSKGSSSKLPHLKGKTAKTSW